MPVCVCNSATVYMGVYKYILHICTRLHTPVHTRAHVCIPPLQHLYTPLHTPTHLYTPLHTPLHTLTQKEQEELPDLSPQEVVRRLRLLGQPATYFGEVWRVCDVCVMCDVYAFDTGVRSKHAHLLVCRCVTCIPVHPLIIATHPSTHINTPSTPTIHPHHPHNTPPSQHTQTDFDRLKRLKKAQQEVQLEDEAAGGGMQDNVALELKRQEEAQQELAKRMALAAGEGAEQGGRKGGVGGVDATEEDAPEDVRSADEWWCLYVLCVVYIVPVVVVADAMHIPSHTYILRYTYKYPHVHTYFYTHTIHNLYLHLPAIHLPTHPPIHIPTYPLIHLYTHTHLPTHPPIHTRVYAQELARAFKRAAELVKQQQQEAAMSDAEKVTLYVRRWAKEWEAEVEAMTPQVLSTSAGTRGECMMGLALGMMGCV